MQKFLEKIKPVYDWIYKFNMLLCKLLLVADIIITAISVTNRYTVKTNMAWTEAIILTLMSYMAVLSAALAIRRDAHIRMNAFDRFIPATAIKVLDVLADIAVLALGVIMLVVGLPYAIKIGAVGTYEAIPSLSRFWMYFPIPLAGVFMILFEIEALLKHISAFSVKEEGK